MRQFDQRLKAKCTLTKPTRSKPRGLNPRIQSFAFFDAPLPKRRLMSMIKLAIAGRGIQEKSRWLLSLSAGPWFNGSPNTTNELKRLHTKHHPICRSTATYLDSLRFLQPILLMNQRVGWEQLRRVLDAGHFLPRYTSSKDRYSDLLESKVPSSPLTSETPSPFILFEAFFVLFFVPSSTGSTSANPSEINLNIDRDTWLQSPREVADGRRGTPGRSTLSRSRFSRPFDPTEMVLQGGITKHSCCCCFPKAKGPAAAAVSVRTRWMSLSRRRSSARDFSPKRTNPGRPRQTSTQRHAKGSTASYCHQVNDGGIYSERECRPFPFSFPLVVPNLVRRMVLRKLRDPVLGSS